MRKLPAKEALVPFPGVEPASPASARYLLSNYGHVYRVDKPRADVDEEYFLRLCNLVKRADFLAVRMGGGKHTKSMLAAMQAAFGNLPRPVHNPDDRLQKSGQFWRLRMEPESPLDELTNHPRCSVVDVEWIYAPTHWLLYEHPATVVPPHHVIPIWVPKPKTYPRYQELKDFHKQP